MYAYQRQELLGQLVMADGKDRQRILRQFDDDLHTPFGAENLAEALNRELARPV